MEIGSSRRTILHSGRLLLFDLVEIVYKYFMPIQRIKISDFGVQTLQFLFFAIIRIILNDIF